MHIPDGFVSPATAAVTYVASGAAVAYAARRANATLGERQVPLMGVSAAFIFAAQMLNFTVAGGTSGHLLGGALAAILLGPWVGTLVITAVLAVQALLFQDGGLLALGANVFNMAVVGVWTGYAVYTVLGRLLGEGRVAVLVRAFAAGWLSVVLAALCCAVELAISGTSSWAVAVPAMGGIHALIGIGEGLITVAVLAFVAVSRPDLLGRQATAEVG
ncbi:MAG: energy-coupling factor ABC transporter permease [Anaerolineae bacterium]